MFKAELSEKLAAQALAVLKLNDRGQFTAPSLGFYPHQVLWDSCFIAIGRSYDNIERAQQEITHLLSGQWQNGMVPHIIFSGKNNWRSSVSPLSPEAVATSGVSQPPMLAEAIVRVGERLSADGRRIWYQKTFPSLLAYHQWLYRERDPDGSGLVVQVHPWETGLDDTPPCMLALNDQPLARWLRLLKSSRLAKLGNYVRFDRKFVSLDERGSNIETLTLYDLLRRIRRQRYDSAAILRAPRFAIQDLTYNCILIRANKRLAEIAKSLGEKLPEELIQQTQSTIKALDGLWDKTTGQYYSRDFRTKKLLCQPSFATFLPLYTGCITHEQAERLVHLMQDQHAFGAKYPLPSVPLNSPWFNAKRYWQGPTWININWFIINGLEQYGFTEQAQTLRQSTLELVAHSGCREYFDPITGEGAGVDNFSWTAALTLDLLASKN